MGIWEHPIYNFLIRYTNYCNENTKLQKGKPKIKYLKNTGHTYFGKPFLQKEIALQK